VVALAVHTSKGTTSATDGVRENAGASRGARDRFAPADTGSDGRGAIRSVKIFAMGEGDLGAGAGRGAEPSRVERYVRGGVSRQSNQCGALAQSC
jgi:hypothetical protein